MAPAAAIHPYFEEPYDLFADERRLAVAVLQQAARDLETPTRRAEATTFLVTTFWGSTWHQWLPHLQRHIVLAFVRAQLATLPRKVERPARPGPSRAITALVGEWRTLQGATRVRVALSCGHERTVYRASTPRGLQHAACAQCRHLIVCAQ